MGVLSSDLLRLVGSAAQLCQLIERERDNGNDYKFTVKIFAGLRLCETLIKAHDTFFTCVETIIKCWHIRLLLSFGCFV